jgi:guanine deaminase
MTEAEKSFMRMAIELSESGVKEGLGGPFGCIVVKAGKVIGVGSNSVLATNDPTAHAEVVAIREACKNLGTHQLQGCTVFASCEPCPMCLGAIYWARPDKVYYANRKEDAASVGFDDDFIYQEINLPPASRKIPFVHTISEEARKAFELWTEKENKTLY